MARLMPFLIAAGIAAAVAFFIQGYYIDQSFTVQSVLERNSSESAH